MNTKDLTILLEAIKDIVTNIENSIKDKQDKLVSGTNIKTIEGQSLMGTGNIDLTKTDVGLANVDNTSDINKPISTATQNALNLKEVKLISGENIKTINNESLLGSGNITIKNNEWIVGEYKWMPTTAIMPEGWIKVAITTGFTLIQGNSEGIYKGEVIHHQHQIDAYVPGNFEQMIVGQKGTINGKSQLWYTTDVGGANNLSAGLYATLWQYNPTKYAEIIAMGLTPREYAEIEQQKENSI